jgi:20S proteasome alpha/beta subunit
VRVKTSHLWADTWVEIYWNENAVCHNAGCGAEIESKSGVSKIYMQNEINNLAEKRFDLETWSGRRLQKKKRRSPVTIVLAIVCRNAIIMAGDSRTTKEDGTIRDDTKKIHTVHLSDRFGFLIGQSGNDDLGTQAIETISELAKQATIKDYRACAELAEKSISLLKQKIRGQFQGTSEELQRHFENHDFDLMLVHYYKEEARDGKIRMARPFIFTIRFSLGIARPHHKNFVSIGCGSPIADFILDGFTVSDFDFSQAMAAAVYVVEQVKTFDPRCGGRTQIATSEKFFEDKDAAVFSAMLVDEKLVDDFLSAVKEVGAEFRAHQHRMMKGIMEKVNRFTSPRIEKIKAESGGIHLGLDGSIQPFKPLKSDSQKTD